MVHEQPKDLLPAHQPERRREQRIRHEEAVLISVLGPPGGEAIPGAIVNLSGIGLKILSTRPLPCGTLVKVQGLNRLLLGEVLRSGPEGDSFSIAVKIKHLLDNLSDLQQLNRHLLSNEEEAPVADLVPVKRKTHP